MDVKDVEGQRRNGEASRKSNTKGSAMNTTESKLATQHTNARSGLSRSPLLLCSSAPLHRRPLAPLLLSFLISVPTLGYPISASKPHPAARGAAAIVAPRPLPPNGAVAAVDSVGITVSDADRAVEFFSRVLSFEKVSDVEVAGGEYEHLQGLFGLRMRVVRMRLGDEFIELTEYLTPRGRPIPADPAHRAGRYSPQRGGHACPDRHSGD